jgi:hypothetical protein
VDQETIMPIEILQSSQPMEADGLVEFNFNNPVIDWAFGFSFFRVTYGTEHHWVRSLMISMLPVASPALAAGSKQVRLQSQFYECRSPTAAGTRGLRNRSRRRPNWTSIGFRQS